MMRMVGLSILLLALAASPIPAAEAGATTAYAIQVRAVPLDAL